MPARCTRSTSRASTAASRARTTAGPCILQAFPPPISMTVVLSPLSGVLRSVSAIAHQSVCVLAFDAALLYSYEHATDTCIAGVSVGSVHRSSSYRCIVEHNGWCGALDRPVMSAVIVVVLVPVPVPVRLVLVRLIPQI